MEGRLDQCATYLLQLAQQRKDSIHVCCRKLQIQGLCKATFIEIFQSIDTYCLQELELSCICIDNVAFLSPYMRQMKNLLTLILTDITDIITLDGCDDFDEKKMSRLISQLPSFHCLQNLYLNNIFFIDENLKECLRCLKNPLETLCLTYCNLSQTDLNYLPHCLNSCKLKYLNLSSIYLYTLSLEPLGVLLERVKDTLQSLELQSCGMTDRHFGALLPGLSQCSHLTKINFCENELSLPVLKQLLEHTAKLRLLSQTQYPAPRECYDNMRRVITQRLENFGPELLDILDQKTAQESHLFYIAMH
ncbi:oogenesin-1-like [Arvicanthis niloticus]|uniref:oogenesin-1-like n=1 Tax=Arvicanthis niloticus TaxID=61156 RepID=UPI001485F90E|nr:oogenesin-1-like [Arvicanthis niloticus]